MQLLLHFHASSELMILWLMDCAQAGVFSIATDNVLKNRSMLTAKRRCSVS